MDIDLTEEDVIKKHKQERKDLQSKITSLKKTVTKGDKKKKKEVTEEITKLEQELDNKQAQELETFQNNSKTITQNNENENINFEANMEISVQDDDEENNKDGSPQQARISRALKRRNKKAQEEREREKRILEQSEKNKFGPRVQEMNTIKENLKSIGLKLYNIPADGNCLYCAINHQLEAANRESYTVSKLRKLTADFMREHKEEFLPFMYSETEEVCSDEYFEDYCKEVANTKLWGGQLELRALSNLLKCPIKIIQASGPATLQGENFVGPELIIAYHRHLYRLGEHYNSTIQSTEDENND